MRRRFAAALRLAVFTDPLLFIRILLFAAGVLPLMRLRLTTLAGLLERVKVAPEPDARSIARVQRCVSLVLGAASPVLRRRCLVRSLTLFYFLRRAGLDVELSFGLGEPGGRVAGHCWLVRDGEPFLERRDPRPVFAEMLRIPRTPTLPVTAAPSWR